MLASSSGIFEFNLKTKEWQELWSPDTINNVKNIQVYQDSIWIANTDKGLYYSSDEGDSWQSHSTFSSEHWKDENDTDVGVTFAVGNDSTVIVIHDTDDHKGRIYINKTDNLENWTHLYTIDYGPTFCMADYGEVAGIVNKTMLANGEIIFSTTGELYCPVMTYYAEGGVYKVNPVDSSINQIGGKEIRTIRQGPGNKIYAGLRGDCNWVKSPTGCHAGVRRYNMEDSSWQDLGLHETGINALAFNEDDQLIAATDFVGGGYFPEHPPTRSATL